ncbi:nitroreductase [Halioglobus maricola]|uniref:Nitroreductase n=1 Tax=Halioglobus maricola TaxID=2601894 RepID=A0A5P9NN64_9GAMM|nr:nitroreductase family protein [Halioglobus maricola]QFU77202.1 nitroreductase [Halioglobus maricola]
MFDKETETSTEVASLLTRRWSGRAYDPERNPTPDQLESLMEAARWAPSCNNAQPWRFLVCSLQESPDARQAVFESLWELNQKWCAVVPVFIVAVARTRFVEPDQENPWAIYDTGAAALSICLQATEMGLMAHQMAGFDAASVQSAFDVPDVYRPVSVITIGYQLQEEAIPESLHEMERAPRTRKNLDQIRSYGDWGQMSDG